MGTGILPLLLLLAAVSKSWVLDRGGPWPLLPAWPGSAAAASGDQEVSVMKPQSPPRGEVSGMRSRVVSWMAPRATSAWPSGKAVSVILSRTSITLKRSLVVAEKLALR